MKIRVAALIGGLLGVSGLLCFLLAFATDYWLLSTDDCGGFEQPGHKQGQANSTEVPEGTEPSASIVVHHEGFFRRCFFNSDPSEPVLSAVLFTNQPRVKHCVHGYLFPLPVAFGPVPHPDYDATAVFRGFWTILIILGVAGSVCGGFLLVCAVPFISPKLYRAGAAFLIAAACLYLALVTLFVVWKELVDVRRYVLQERGTLCPDAHLEAHYGWSFIVAVAGTPLVLVSGLLFFCIGRTLKQHV